MSSPNHTGGRERRCTRTLPGTTAEEQTEETSQKERKKLRVALFLPKCNFFPLHGYKRGERERIQAIPK
jgi:hypothetical protein